MSGSHRLTHVSQVPFHKMPAEGALLFSTAPPPPLNAPNSYFKTGLFGYIWGPNYMLQIVKTFLRNILFKFLLIKHVMCLYT